MQENIVSLLKESFSGDVLFDTVFGDDKGALEAYIRCSLEACEKHGGVITINNSAVVTWVPATAFPPSISESELTVHEKEVIGKFELHENTPETIISRSAKNFGYIWFLAVSSAARGKGFAKQLIDKAVAEMASKGFSECWLSTENPDNKTFYRHNGFSLVDEKVSEMGIKSMVFMKKI